MDRSFSSVFIFLDNTHHHMAVGAGDALYLLHVKKREASSPFTKYVGLLELGFSPKTLKDC